MTAQLGNVECHTVFWLFERLSEGQSTPKGQNNGRRKSLFQFKCPFCFSHVVWEPRVNNMFPQERFRFLSQRNGIESCNNSDWQTSFFFLLGEVTPSIPKIIWVKNVREIVVCGFLMKWLKKCILEIWKKSWVPFGSYLLNSTANPAQFEWKWAGLAVLFSR